RKRDHLADRLLAGERRDDPVEPHRDPAMGRRAVAERVEQEPESGLGLLGADPDDLEHAPLDVRAIDADRSATDLAAVEYQVVGARLQAGGVIEVARRRREGMVRGVPALLVRVPQERGKVDDPENLVTP